MLIMLRSSPSLMKEGPQKTSTRSWRPHSLFLMKPHPLLLLQIGQWRDVIPPVADELVVRFVASKFTGETILHCKPLPSPPWLAPACSSLLRSATFT
jgi:hypothetical protein